MKVNALNEIEEILQEHKLAWRNVKYIANAEGTVAIGAFIVLARQYNYDNSGESLGIDPTLIIAGGSWWLSRIRVNDQEKWLFHKKPQKPTLASVDFAIGTHRPPNKITLL